LGLKLLNFILEQTGVWQLLVDVAHLEVSLLLDKV